MEHDQNSNGQAREKTCWMSALRTVGNWLVPMPSQSGIEETGRRARFVVAVCCTIACCGIPFAVSYYRAEAYAASATCAVGVGLVPGFLLLLRETGSWKLSGNLATADLFLVLTGMALTTGGADAPALWWYAAVPIAATSMIGQWAGQVWTAIAMVTLTLFAVAADGGYQFHDDLTPAQHRTIGLVSIIGLVGLICVMTHLFERFQRRTQRLFQEKEECRRKGHRRGSGVPRRHTGILLSGADSRGQGAIRSVG